MKKIITYILFVILLSVFIFLTWYKLGAYFYNQGNYYFELKDYGVAASYFKKAIKINPKAWMAYLGLADTYRGDKKYKEAVQEYEKVLSFNPSFPRAYEFLADVYYQQGDYPLAREILLRGQRANPMDEKIKDSLKSNCSAYLADTLAKSTDLFIAKKSREATIELEKVLQICPGNALAYYTLGYYYLSGQDYSNAEINLDKSLKIDPKFYHSYKLLSEIYLKERDMEKAILFAKKALDANNNDASGYHNLGLLLMRLERYSQALPYLQKASSLEPNNVEYAYSLASIYRDNKMLPQAVTAYKKVCVLKNDYPNLHNDLADIYAVLRMPSQALVEYEKEVQNCQRMIKDYPQDPIVLNSYAYALNGAGKLKQALEVAESLVAAYPRYRQAHLTLAKIYEKMKQGDLALGSLEKARQLSSGENFINDEIVKLKHDPLIKGKAAREKIDRIYLKNGNKIEGKVKKEYPDKLVLEVWLGSTFGELTFYRNAIARIEKIQD